MDTACTAEELTRWVLAAFNDQATLRAGGRTLRFTCDGLTEPVRVSRDDGAEFEMWVVLDLDRVRGRETVRVRGEVP